eukprot:38790-Pleurochrysis_carterae.AAC.1
MRLWLLRAVRVSRSCGSVNNLGKYSQPESGGDTELACMTVGNLSALTHTHKDACNTLRKKRNELRTAAGRFRATRASSCPRKPAHHR